jgi:DNA invertase Pin-like site-specific DNA recombinase
MTEQEQNLNTRQAHFLQLPIKGKVVFYARVASRRQLAETAPSAQIVELQDYAAELRFGPEQVTVFVDEGARAAGPLLERQGYAALLAAIQAREITALFLHSENRLFADATELEVDTFIQLCIEKGVCVVTSQMVYDFRNPSHVALFRANYVGAFELLDRTAKAMRRKTAGRCRKRGEED